MKTTREKFSYILLWVFLLFAYIVSIELWASNPIGVAYRRAPAHTQLERTNIHASGMGNVLIVKECSSFDENPANLIYITNPIVTIESKYTYGCFGNLSSISYSIPLCCAIVYPINKFRLGISRYLLYDKYYRQIPEFYENSNPVETNELDVWQETYNRIYTTALSLAYQPYSCMSVGVSLNLYQETSKNKGQRPLEWEWLASWEFKQKGSGTGLNGNISFISERFDIGIALRLKSRLKGQWEHVVGREIVARWERGNYFHDVIPTTLDIGGTILIGSKWQVAGSISYMLWSEYRESFDPELKYEAVGENWEDKPEEDIFRLHFGAEYKTFLPIRFGFLEEIGENGSWENLIPSFFTIGTKFSLRQFTINMSIQDSHISYYLRRHHLEGKVGLKCSLSHEI